MRDRFERFLLEIRLVLEAIDQKEFDDLALALGRADRIFIGGLGRTGALMRAFAARLAQLDRRVHVILEPGCPELEEDDLLLLASGSGATRTLIVQSEEARKRKARVALITSNMLGPLNQGAELKLYLPPTLALGDSGPGLVKPGQTAFEQALLLVLDALAEALPKAGGGA